MHPGVFIAPLGGDDHEGDDGADDYVVTGVRTAAARTAAAKLSALHPESGGASAAKVNFTWLAQNLGQL